MNQRFWIKNRNNASFSGFTLVEVLITVAIVAIIMGVMGTLFFSGATAYNEGSKKAFVQNDTRLGMELIQNEIRYAEILNLIDGNINPETEGSPGMSYIIFTETTEKLGRITIYSRKSETEFVQMSLPGEYTNQYIYSIISDEDSELVLLGLRLMGSNTGTEFQLETTINLLNMSSMGNQINKDDGTLPSESLAIEYLK